MKGFRERFRIILKSISAWMLTMASIFQRDTTASPIETGKA